MKPASFTYHAPETVDDTLAVLTEHAGSARVLAGGQSLVPLLNRRTVRAEHLVDINGVAGLAGLVADGDELRIGALVRQAALERSEAAHAGWPILRAAVGHIAHPQIRNRGTVGGSAAHADPGAELPATFAALDASFALASARGRRTIGWEAFFTGRGRTAAAADELLTGIAVPRLPARTAHAFLEHSRRTNDPALGGAAVLLTLDEDGRCERAAIALLAAAETPVRAHAAEASLAGEVVDARSAATAAAEAVTAIEPGYRRRVIETLVARALLAAVRRSSSPHR